jgi:transcriptional regulator with XRE-family HTH domain
MEESLHDYVVRQLQLVKGQWPDISEETGIARSTIVKIARREVADPGVSLIERLARYFRQKQAA